MSKRLALGTVQFGMEYGINNPDGIPDASRLESIFSIASETGIALLDTAEAYGDAEEKIGKHACNRFNIVTKFSRATGKTELENKLENSLQKLQISSVYGYLAHNADNLIEVPALWDALLSAKKKGKIEKAGYSLYSTGQLTELLRLKMIPDLIQIPYSVLDRKFEPQLSEIKQMGIEIHVRSVFLQGLYFMPLTALTETLKPLAPVLNELHEVCTKYEITIGSLALNFAAQNQYIDHVVIGVNTPEQLAENSKLVSSWRNEPGLADRINDIKVSTPELLNPSNW